MTPEEFIAEYARLGHAIQSGVAYAMEREANQVSPKHLRTGLNCVMADFGSLGRLLIAKGVITQDEYGSERVREGVGREDAGVIQSSATTREEETLVSRSRTMKKVRGPKAPKPFPDQLFVFRENTTDSDGFWEADETTDSIDDGTPVGIYVLQEIKTMRVTRALDVIVEKK